MNTASRPDTRRIVVARTETVVERTLHELSVPDEVSDEDAVEWALECCDTSALPPAIGVAHTMVDGEVSVAVHASARYDPDSAPPPRRDYQVAAAETSAALTLRFHQAGGVTLSVTGLARAALTYEWVRAGEDGEHVAVIAADGVIETTDLSGPGCPTWVARFARAASALGGRFDHVAVLAECPALALGLSAGNEEDAQLTIGETAWQPLGREALITACGVKRGVTADTGALIVERVAGGYWSLAGEAERYSDVALIAAGEDADAPAA